MKELNRIALGSSNRRFQPVNQNAGLKTANHQAPSEPTDGLGVSYDPEFPNARHFNFRFDSGQKGNSMTELGAPMLKPGEQVHMEFGALKSVRGKETESVPSRPQISIAGEDWNIAVPHLNAGDTVTVMKDGELAMQRRVLQN